MHEDIERWDRKYARRTGESLFEPDTVLMQQPLANAGLALDVGCGRGANTHYLASLGYDAIGLDCSFEALRQSKSTGDNSTAHFAVVDLDGYAIPVARFDLIVVVKYLNRSLVSSIRAAIKPGGLLFYRTFNRRHLQRHARFNADYVLAPGELLRCFDGFEIINQLDSAEDSLSYLFARRPLATGV